MSFAIKSLEPDSLEPRLAVLRQGGLLNDENYGRVRDIITFLREKHNLELAEGNASSFVTHLCAALERISRGEEIGELDPDVYEAAKSEPVFDKALQLTLELQKRYPVLPDAEIKFITMHIAAFLIE